MVRGSVDFCIGESGVNVFRSSGGYLVLWGQARNRERLRGWVIQSGHYLRVPSLVII